MAAHAMIFSFWILSFKQVFSLSFFAFLKRLSSFSLLSAISMVREGNGNPLQYSCLETPMDGGAWWAAVHGVAKGQTWLSDFTFTFHFHALEKKMATHSTVLAWRIPGTGSLVGYCLWGHTRLKRLSSSSSISMVSFAYLNLPTFLWQSWFQLVICPAQHFVWCTLLISKGQNKACIC